MNNSAAIIIIMFLCLTNIGQVILRAESRATIIAAINDRGKATDYKLNEIVQRIDNYNLDSLKGNK